MKPLLLVVDDHPLFRAGVHRALSELFSVMEADSLRAALVLLASHPQVSLVLLDLRLPDTQGLTGLETLAAHHGDIPRVVISGDDDPTLASRVRAAGASGFIHKSADMRALCASLTQVLEGHMVFEAATEKPRGDALSMRELEVLTLVSRGLQNREIAMQLNISERTVKAHLKAAFDALGARTRTEAAYVAVRSGLIESP